jgi:Bacterial shufflon protein, N-terminal constant region
MKTIKENGFLSIEAIGAVIISLLSLMVGAEIYNNWCDNLEYNAAAQHLAEVEKGAKNYIHDHYHELIEKSHDNKKNIVKIQIKELKNKKYLPDSFSTTNSFGQTYSVRIKKAPPVNDNPQLQAIIITVGGSQISELGVRKIATMLGAHGGYFAEESGNRVIQGALGAWSEKANAFGPDLDNGHLAAALFFIDNKSSSRDFLYRKPVPGKSEMNQMKTTLDMNNNNLINAKDIKTHSVFATKTIKSNNIYSEKILSTNETLQFAKASQEGSSCSMKSLGITIDGSLLICKENRWRNMDSRPTLETIRVIGDEICNDGTSSSMKKSARVICPDGYILSGGSYDVTTNNDHDQLSTGIAILYPTANFSNFFSKKDDNAWEADVSKMKNVCLKPVATCMKIVYK